VDNQSMSTPETVSSGSDGLQGPNLYIVNPETSAETSSERESTLEEQAASVRELVSVIRRAKKDLGELPREALIAAAGQSIAEYKAAYDLDHNTPEAHRLGEEKDDVLQLLSPEDRHEAMFLAND
jgi:uncharacterized protein YkwD